MIWIAAVRTDSLLDRHSRDACTEHREHSLLNIDGNDRTIWSDQLRSGAREKTWTASEIGNGHSVPNPRRQDFYGIVQEPAELPIGCGLHMMCSTVAFGPELSDLFPELRPPSAGLGEGT